MLGLKLSVVVCVAALVVQVTKPANAAMITETFNFTASGFPFGPPVDPVNGSFTITFDPTVSTPNGTTVSINSVNVPQGTSNFFTYDAGFEGGFLTVCSVSVAPSCSVGVGETGFFIEINDVQTNPTFVDFAYGSTGAGGSFLTSTGSVSLAAVPGPVVGAGLPGLILAGGRWPARLVATEAKGVPEIRRALRRALGRVRMSNTLRRRRRRPWSIAIRR